MTQNQPTDSQNRAITEAYLSFEKSILCTNGHPGAYAHLPHFNGNKSQPIHRWFTYKEGFSSELVDWVCKTTGKKLNHMQAILDPFLGVGTSLLSSQLNYRGRDELKLFGIERNPFAAFVSRTKLNWPQYDVNSIGNLIPKLTTAISKRRGRKFDLAELSTVRDQRVFNRKKLYDLLFAHHVIKTKVNDPQVRDFFLLGWASIIESISGVRKDGRALRIVSKETRPPVHEMLGARWHHMLSDLKAVALSLNDVHRGAVVVNVSEGDGRTLECLNGSSEQFDLILYSPPYLNNIDYSEVYKLELWLTGLVTNAEEFRQLRRSTFRSHPSIRFPETNFVSDLAATSWPRRLLTALLDGIGRDKDYAWRCRLIKGYVDDMLISLRNQFTKAKPGANVVCVVGNSLHGSKVTTPVATDLFIAALAQEVGFEVERLQITRHTQRRSRQHPVRESIIIMRRPTGKF